MVPRQLVQNMKLNRWRNREVNPESLIDFFGKLNLDDNQEGYE